MIRRRLVLIAVAVLSLMALFSVTLPALATTATPPGSPESVPFGDAQLQNPGMAAAMARDLKLSPEQTQARITMETWARRTESSLRGKLGSRFGGAWITDDGGNLVVGVTDSASTAAVRATGAQARVVTRSATELTALKSTLDRAAAAPDGAVRGWYIDIATNTVVVLAKPAAMGQAQAFVTASGADPAAVRVMAAPEVFRPLFDVRGGDAYFINGSARCSVGFSVTGGFVTAGHCGRVGSPTTGFNQAAQGRIEGSTFPGNGDFGLVEVNDDWTPQPVVAATNRTVSVAGSSEAAIGSSVCRSGSTTGWHCGVIEAKDATVNYPEGLVTGLTQTNVCAEGGDSGGSFISGNQAQGVTSGGSGDCRVGGTTFFQPVNEILTAFRARLVTTAGGGGGASAPPPGAQPPADDADEPPPPADAAEPNCAASEAIFRGALAGGAAQVQPNGTFYETTGSGSQLGCLQAPAGAEFTLTLQRWDGRQFQTVARAPAGPGNKRLAVTSPAGFYRWQVTAVEGSGAYTLGLTAT